MRKLLLALLLIPSLCFAGQMGATRVLGNYTADNWVRVYNTTIAANTTEVVISGLNGDVDEEYILKYTATYGANSLFFVRPNNDSGANYGAQWLTAYSTTTEAYNSNLGGTWTGFRPNYASLIAAGEVEQAEYRIYAKSGAVRTATAQFALRATGTTQTYIEQNGYVWNNTATNIANITMNASATGGWGIGSTIELYKRGVKQ